MKGNLAPAIRLLWTLTAIAVAAVSACTSRYRMDLFYLSDGERSKIDVEQALVAPATRLNEPFTTPDIVTGDRSTAVITVSMRGERLERGSTYQALSFDQYLQYRIYLELPPAPLPDQSDTIPLARNSYVRLMGFYERPPSEKTFLPVTTPAEPAGVFVIDSIRHDDLYGTFAHAWWVNSADERIGFDGRVKIKLP